MTLALSIGANTAIFSVLDAAVFNVLPFPDPEHLVSLDLRTNRGDFNAFSYPNFKEMREQSRSVQLSSWTSDQANLQTSAEPVRIDAPRVSANFFTVLQSQPLIGRFFVPDDEREGAPRTIVLSEGLWRQRFAADRTLIGRKIRVNSEPYTVIGIARRFVQLPQHCRGCAWLPLQQLRTPEFMDRDVASFHLVGRISARSSREQAEAELTGLAQRFEAMTGDHSRVLGVRLTSLAASISQDYRTELYLILGAVLLVLMIGCVNVANLLLAKSTARQSEISLRVALGASRGRIVAQALTESLLLASVSVIFALMIAAEVLRIVQTIGAGYVAAVSTAHIDLRVLLFAIAAAIGTSLIAGLAPALMMARTGQTQLRESSVRTGTSKRQQQLRGALVAGESALALMLIVSTGLLLRTLYALEHKDLGMVIGQVTTCRITPSPAQYQKRDVVIAWYEPLLQKLWLTPGVTAAGIGSFLPLERSGVRATIKLQGDRAERPPVSIRLISPGYLQALGVSILRGRDFSESDRPNTPFVAIINDRLAKRDFQGRDPIGQQVALMAGKEISYTIIGVEHSYQQRGPQTDPEPEIALDVLQFDNQKPLYDIATLQIGAVVRSSLTQETIRSRIQNAVWSIDSTQPVSDIQTLQQVLSESVAAQRFALTIFGGFACLAILLAAAGIYSTLSWVVAQRRREIGVRMALGATRYSILILVLARSLGWTMVGAVVGILATLASGKIINNLIWGVSSFDPLTLTYGLVILVVIAGLASVLPAFRAARAEPIHALRSE
jgi:predicted permease